MDMRARDDWTLDKISIQCSNFLDFLHTLTYKFRLYNFTAMRGKRSKQYRKLMNQYGMTFGFREPYQVLLDAQIIEDAARFKMDLIGGLERTLHGQVKPSKLTTSHYLYDL
jgi:hypothetical protein